MRTGYKHTEETKSKMRLARLRRQEKFGYLNSPETREKMRLARLGKKPSLETRRKMGLSHLGNTPGNKGKHISDETKEKISKALKGRSATTIITGKDHYLWKGDDVGYRVLHSWVIRHLGQPPFCSKCGKFGTGHEMQWANKSGQYKRDLTDWLRLCAKCHKKYDSREREAIKEFESLTDVEKVL